MKQANYRKKAPAAGQGQFTINIFAMFMSVVVFLFVQQAGILLMNVMFSLGYPSNLDNVDSFLGSIVLIVFLTLLFGVASQMGHSVVLRTEAQRKILVVYNSVVLLILIIQGISVAMMTVPMYIVPNLLIGAAIVYTLYILVTGRQDSLIKQVRRLRK